MTGKDYISGEVRTAVRLVNEPPFGDLVQVTLFGAHGFLFDSLNPFEKAIEDLAKEIIEIGI